MLGITPARAEKAGGGSRAIRQPLDRNSAGVKTRLPPRPSRLCPRWPLRGSRRSCVGGDAPSVRPPVGNRKAVVARGELRGALTALAAALTGSQSSARHAAVGRRGTGGAMMTPRRPSCRRRDEDRAGLVARRAICLVRCAVASPERDEARRHRAAGVDGGWRSGLLSSACSRPEVRDDLHARSGGEATRGLMSSILGA